MPTKKTTTPAGEKPKRAPRRKQVQVTPEQIASRAYELWLEGREGDPLAHWLMAEDELLGRAA
jgi:hypothetical protein